MLDRVKEIRMSQQHTRIGFVPRGNYELEAAMQLLELRNQEGVHTYTRAEQNRYNTVDSQSVGAQSVQSVVGGQSVGDYRSQPVGDYRSQSVGAQSVQSVVGGQSVGDYRSQPVQSVAMTTHTSEMYYSMNGRPNMYTSPTNGFVAQTSQQQNVQLPFSPPTLPYPRMVAPKEPPFSSQMSRTPQQQQNAQSNKQSSPAIASLNQAEEDRFLAWRLIQRILASITIEDGDMEELKDKQDALVRASKRLEESTVKVELRQRKAGVPMEERLDAIERHEMQAMKVNSTLRKIAKKLNGDVLTHKTDASTKYTGIRLPKMELKTFDGNVRRWHEFWECFEHDVHNNDSLPDHQKLQYLKNCLKGAAFVTISDLDMKGDHYPAAVRLLKERYGHKNVLRKSHFDGLESLPAITHSYDLEKLKRFYDELECHVKALAAIDVRPEEYTTTMIPKIISKLPVNIRIKLTEGQEENEDLKVQELLEGLRKSIKVMEKYGVQMKAQSEHGRQFERKPHKMTVPSPSRPVMSSGATLTSIERKEKCEFCLGQHQAAACKKYQTVKEREMVVKKYNRCFGCLKQGHMLRQCKNAKVCKKCGKEKHHWTLCRATNEPTGVINQALLMGPTAAIAYQAVIAKVQPANGGKKVTCRVLLDSGSARSFITEKLARRLESKPIGGKQCQRFEGINETIQDLETESHMVKLTSLDGKYSNDMEVKTLPAITTIGNPAPLKLKQLYSHLKDLYFTDVTKKKLLEVDMLLGSEHLAEIQTGCIKNGKRGEPTAVLTRLGWTLMGSTVQGKKQRTPEPTNLIVEDVPDNPSDLGTRGATASKLQNCKLWWEGPHFLKGKKKDWPMQPDDLKPSEEAEAEEKAPIMTIKTEGRTQLSNVIAVQRFSSFRKLLGCVARIKRFTKNCKLKGKDDDIGRGVALETIVNGNKRRLERAVQQINPLELCAEVGTKKDSKDRDSVEKTQ